MGLAIKALGATFTKYFDVASPLALPDIEAYWRADDISSGAVASWTDLTGNGRHLVQATSGSRPTNTASQINGHKAVVFDGTDDYLDLSSLVIPQPWELWLVVKRITSVAGDFLFEIGNVTLGAGYFNELNATQIRGQSGSTVFTITVGAVGSWLVLRFKSVAGTSASGITLNNGTEAVGTMTNGIQRFILGAKVGGTLNPNIAVAEAFVTSDTLTSAEQTMVYDYLRDRYALAV